MAEIQLERRKPMDCSENEHPGVFCVEVDERGTKCCFTKVMEYALMRSSDEVGRMRGKTHCN